MSVVVAEHLLHRHGRASTPLRPAGEWHNVETLNLDNYLKQLGVAWAKRKVACSFKPKATWSLNSDGILQARPPTFRPFARSGPRTARLAPRAIPHVPSRCTCAGARRR